jgi:hypothetical protein
LAVDFGEFEQTETRAAAVAAARRLIGESASKG